METLWPLRAEAVWLCLKHKARRSKRDVFTSRGLALPVDRAGRPCALCLHKAAGAGRVTGPNEFIRIPSNSSEFILFI